MCENKYKKIEEKEMKGGSLMRKSGFTLAEVLITLVIIGVIAAMTIPGLLANTGKAELISSLKKAVSTMTQALTLEAATTGNTMAAVANNLTAFNEFMFRSFNINAAKTGTNPTTDGWYNADGMIFKLTATAGWPSSSTECSEDMTACYIAVDVNGDKGPNRCAGEAGTCATNDWVKNTTQIRDRYIIQIFDDRIQPVGAAVNVFFDNNIPKSSSSSN